MSEVSCVVLRENRPPDNSTPCNYMQFEIEVLHSWIISYEM